MEILIWISIKFVLKGPINNNLAFVHVKAWRRTDKSLPEPVMV